MPVFRTVLPICGALVATCAITALASTSWAVCPAPTCPAGQHFVSSGNVCIVDSPAVPCLAPCDDCVPWTDLDAGGQYCGIETTASAGKVWLATTDASPDVRMDELECISAFHFLVDATGPSATQVSGLETLTCRGLTLLDTSMRIQTDELPIQYPYDNRLTRVDMRNLTAIHGHMQFLENPFLISIDFDWLGQVDSDVIFEDNDELTNLGPTWELTAIGTDLRLSDNNRLADIGAIARLQTIGDDFIITAESSLGSTAVLQVLMTVGGTMKFDGTRLVTIELISLTSAHRVWIRDNNQLMEVDLPSLALVTDKFIVESNHPVLRTIRIPNLQQIGGPGGGYEYSTTNPDGLTTFDAPGPVPPLGNCPNWFSLDVDTGTPDCASNALLHAYNDPWPNGCGIEGTVIP